MPGAELVSKALRNAIREYFVGTTLATINMTFEESDIAPDDSYVPSSSGARRSRVEQYYKTLDWTNPKDVQKFLEIVEAVQLGLDNSLRLDIDSERTEAMLALIATHLKRAGVSLVDGRLRLPTRILQLDNARRSIAHLDAPELKRQLDRMQETVESDPSLAIGTAKELAESACKTVLEDCGVKIEADWDLGQLVKKTREELKLLPEDVPEAAKGADVIRRLLGNLGTVVQSLGELRNLYGTGHGKKASAKGLTPRHARLAVGASTAFATFVLETHWHRKAPPRS